MESYKHSCPVCGQHVEYTAGYCGRQMQCPICGNTITFPAIPTSVGGKPAAVMQQKPARKWLWDAKAIFLYLRDFPHWHTVGQILVPFLIIGVLLGGALFVKNKFADEPAPAAAPVVQVEQGGWDKMTELARADQKMQQYVQAIIQARRTLTAAQRNLETQEKQYNQLHDPDEKQAVSVIVQSAKQATTQAERNLSSLHQRFDTESESYRKLGGTIDYRSRLPNN